MFYDRATIYVEAGAGGNGCISFRREAGVPKGGPDGGDGGGGGDVVLVCDGSLRDLEGIRHAPHLKAGRGGHGRGKTQHGARGKDLVARVPPGSTIEGLEGESFDLTEAGQRALVARGGSGGHGNKRFATSTRQAPRFAERGLPGASGEISLQLRLIADAGLIGLPNAGKSSLLRALTAARPKVADYPFTTVDPMLGVVEYDDRQVVLADIPGLIEGASEGVGLGHEFLAHVERCRVLLHVVDLGGPLLGADPQAGVMEQAYETIRAELAGHGAGLERRPEILVLSKADLVAEDLVRREAEAWRERLGERVVVVSSATSAGLDDLRRALLEATAATSAEAPDALALEFEADHATYRPAAEQGYSVEAIGEGAFAVLGRGVETLIARHDPGNAEAMAYLEGRLREMGVIAELKRAGFKGGDEVQIGEGVFMLDTGA